MMFFLIFSILCLIGAGVNVVLNHKRKAAIRSSHNEKKALREAFSLPALDIISSYEGLPEEHRPSYDIKAALTALDKKYSRDGVNFHFERFYSYNSESYFSWACPCISGHWDDFDYDDEDDDFDVEPVEFCRVFPEYAKLNESIVEIKAALRAREDAIEKRERQMELAGIENDLRSIDEITEALRNERDLINSVTKEIMP